MQTFGTHVSMSLKRKFNIIMFLFSYSMQSSMSPMSPSMNSYNSTFSNNMMGSPLTSM